MGWISLWRHKYLCRLWRDVGVMYLDLDVWCDIKRLNPVLQTLAMFLAPAREAALHWNRGWLIWAITQHQIETPTSRCAWVSTWGWGADVPVAVNGDLDSAVLASTDQCSWENVGVYHWVSGRACWAPLTVQLSLNWIQQSEWPVYLQIRNVGILTCSLNPTPDIWLH